MIATTVRVLVLAGALMFAGSAAPQTTVLPDAASQPDAVPPAATAEPPKPPEPAPSPAPEPQAAAPQAAAPQATAPEAPAPAETPPPAEPAAQPPPAPVSVQTQSLDQLDLFSTGRDTGLGQGVWKGSSADIARQLIPSLAVRPLSPAAAGLARRLLAQASIAPAGAGGDLDLAVARARALLAVGDAEDASLVLDRTPGLAEHADLSQLAADAALISDQDDKACRVADNLTEGRSGRYWLLLRAFCQARAGKRDAAQLTFDLAGPPAKGAARSRLLGVFIAGTGDPGPASMRTALDFALSRALSLDLTPAAAGASLSIRRYWGLKALPPIGPGDGSPDPVLQTLTAVAGSAPNSEFAGVFGSGEEALESLVDRAAHEADPRRRARAQAAAAILASLGATMSPVARAQFSTFVLARPEAPPAQAMALDAAAEAGLKGETALLALAMAQTGGEAGPATADRCRIIRALMRTGLRGDAQAFAVEGLLALGRPG